MKRIATAAITLSALMMLTGTALADHHEGEEMAPNSGADSANMVEESTVKHDEGAMSDEPIVEEGGTDTANAPSDADASHAEGSLDDDMAPKEGVDSANDPED
ncbi:hypothetical protein [Halomonas organivorans]|uniref:Pentapeptide MXKDX repeat protein n=1 Tax=Halomonas organivorans TaxID=257772 RepID=A0A7W5BUR1_9GAMM|nr:hypothetical protein [Halomonas organivorans]MBB3139194.1 hypothetical protein [Halomonas organivorans]